MLPCLSSPPIVALGIMPDDPVLPAVTAAMVLCVLLGIAFKVVAIFRDYGDQTPRGGVSESLDPAEMLRRGEISEMEFRRMEGADDR